MSKDRRKPRKGLAGDAQGFLPSGVHDAQSLSMLLADKARAPTTERARAPRNRDGQATNYAGFGDQYFRLKSSLVRITDSDMVKRKGRLVRAERTPEDKKRARLAHQARQIILNLEDTD